MSSDADDPVVETYTPSLDFEGLGELTDLHYDLWTLRLRVEFPELGDPVYVTFDGPWALRVLDESDLLEFWCLAPRPAGWIWLVKKGGWLDHEKTRPGFHGTTLGDYDEYMVVTKDDCVSVITKHPPRIRHVDLD